jgi:hypothetical protein
MNIGSLEKSGQGKIKNFLESNENENIPLPESVRYSEDGSMMEVSSYECLHQKIREI